MAGVGEVNQTENWDDRTFTELYPNARRLSSAAAGPDWPPPWPAAEQGLRVILFEGRAVLGGFYDWRVRAYEDRPLFERASDLVAKVEASDNIRVFTSTFVMNVNGDNWSPRSRWAGTEITSINATSRFGPKAWSWPPAASSGPLIYENNDLPGTMQVGAAVRLARTYGLKPGDTAVFSIGDDLGLEAAWDLKMLGVGRTGLRRRPSRGDRRRLAPQTVEILRIEYLPGWSAVEAQDQDKVEGVTLGDLAGEETKTFALRPGGRLGRPGPPGRSPGRGRSQTGLRRRDSASSCRPNCRNGFTRRPSARPGRPEGGGSLGNGGRLRRRLRRPASPRPEGKMNAAAKALEGLPGPAAGCKVVVNHHMHYGKKAFICFDEDGTYKTAKQSAMQGMDMPELAKRFGGFGLGPARPAPGGQPAPGHGQAQGRRRRSGPDDRPGPPGSAAVRGRGRAQSQHLQADPASTTTRSTWAARCGGSESGSGPGSSPETRPARTRSSMSATTSADRRLHPG